MDFAVRMAAQLGRSYTCTRTMFCYSLFGCSAGSVVDDCFVNARNSMRPTYNIHIYNPSLSGVQTINYKRIGDSVPHGNTNNCADKSLEDK